MKHSIQLKQDYTRPLQVFLCHSSDDKMIVHNLFQRLLITGFQPWIDKQSLVGGDQWEKSIRETLDQTDVVIVCLSVAFLSNDRFVQTELNYAMEVANSQNSGHKFIVPIKLEACEIPEILRKFHVVSYFEEDGFEWLLKALNARAKELDILLNEAYEGFIVDKEIFRFYRRIFDRPAFRGPFSWQTDPVPFKKGMELTLKAINTGILKDKMGITLIEGIPSREEIKSEMLAITIEEVAARLKTICNLAASAASEPGLTGIGNIDEERDIIIKKLNEIWITLGIRPMTLPTQITDSTYSWE